MTNHDNPYYCRPVSRLSEVAEQFIMDDTNNDQQMMTKHSSLPQQKDLKYYLNQSIHSTHLLKYKLWLVHYPKVFQKIYLIRC